MRGEMPALLTRTSIVGVLLETRAPKAMTASRSAMSSASAEADPPAATICLDHLLGRFGEPVDDEDVRPFGRQGGRDGRAQPAAAAGHHRRLAERAYARSDALSHRTYMT